MDRRSLKKLVHKLLRSKFFPSRKTITTGLTGMLAYYLVIFFHISPDVAAGIVAAASTLISYVIPPSVTDLARHADYVITDVTGKVTDLMWKFDRMPNEPKREQVRKEITHANTAVTSKPTEGNQPDNATRLGGSASCPDSDSCSGPSGKQVLPE
jgi:hypothetical protein